MNAPVLPLTAGLIGLRSMPVENVLAHTACTLAVYALLKFIWDSPWAAAAGAVLFAVHPMQIAAVRLGWQLPVAGALAMFSLWQYLQASRMGRCACATNHRIASIIGGVAAVVLAPAMLSLAAIAFVLDYVGYSRPWRTAIRSALWLAVPTLSFAVTMRLLSEPLALFSTPIYLRPLLPLDSAAFYLAKLAVPYPVGPNGRNAHVVMVYFVWWTWLLPVAIGTLLFLFQVGRAYLVAAALIFAFAVLPTCGLFPAASQATSIVADHYAYLAMFAPALALSGWLSRPRPLSWKFLIAAWLIALALLSEHLASGRHFL